MENKEELYEGFKSELKEVVEAQFMEQKEIRSSFFIAITTKGMQDLIKTYPEFGRSIKKFDKQNYEDFLKDFEGSEEEAKREYTELTKKPIHVMHIDMHHFFCNSLVANDPRMEHKFKLAARELMQECINKVLSVSITEFVGFSFVLECNYQAFTTNKETVGADTEKYLKERYAEFKENKAKNLAKEGVLIYFETPTNHDTVLYNILRNKGSDYAELFEEDFGKALPIEVDASKKQFSGLFSEFIPKLNITKSQMN